MAKLFKPYVSYLKNGKDIGLTIPRYATVKSKLKAFIQDSDDGFVRVYRSRRGEWGEWFEHWAELPNGKIKKITEGWN